MDSAGRLSWPSRNCTVPVMLPKSESTPLKTSMAYCCSCRVMPASQALNGRKRNTANLPVSGSA